MIRLRARVTIVAIAVLMLSAECAQAQIRPFYITRGRGAEGRAQSFSRDYEFRARLERECENVGCLVIINTSATFDIVGFYFDTRMPGDDGPPQWGPIQFANIRLASNQATFTVKVGDGTMCGVLVRAVLRSRTTDEEIEAVLGRVDLCTDPEHQNTMLPITVVQPSVSIEPVSD